ncbi:class I SAM-dependent rRNA methyltransferase [Fundidesulfovibrio butyratiphilus]
MYLKKHEERRLLAGHLWVFSNEVDTARSPLGAFAPGDQAQVRSFRDKPLGVAYVNPGSLICARLCDRNPAARLDRGWLTERLRLALSLRDALFDKPFYRLVHGEGDHLPGLVVDRYDDILCVQLLTAGMERLRQEVIDALVELTGAKAVVLRSDVAARKLEGLSLEVETVLGQVPDQIMVPEGPGLYAASLVEGQKTGWFYDQRPNRLALAPLAKGKRVLDVFSYLGALGVGAALAGAERVVCVDASQAASALARQNAETNGVAHKVEVVRGEAQRVLEDLVSSGERFDVVSLDPPAFVKRKKDLEAGLGAYHQINRLAAKLLTPDAVAATSSCSQHLGETEFVRMAHKSYSGPRRRAQIIRRGGQGPDHPEHPAMPETRYLKSLMLRVVSGGSAQEES